MALFKKIGKGGARDVPPGEVRGTPSSGGMRMTASEMEGGEPGGDPRFGRMGRKMEGAKQGEELQRLPRRSANKEKFGEEGATREKKTKEKRGQGASASGGLFQKRGKSDTVVSIDFGSAALKVVVGKVDRKKLKIQSAFTIPVTPSVYDNGAVRNQEEIKRLIREALKSHGVSETKIAGTIEGKNIIKRELVVPKVETKDLESLVAFEIGQYLPVDPENNIIQFKEIESFQEDGVKKLRLLVVLMPKDMAEGIYRAVDECKLVPYALDVHFNSIEKLVELNGYVVNNTSVVDKNIAFVDIGYSRTNVIVLSNGKYKFNSIVDLGRYHFDKKIEEILGHLNLQERRMIFSKAVEPAAFSAVALAEANPTEYLQNPDEGFRITKALKEQMDFLIREIRRTLQYITVQRNDAEIERVYLYGGGIKGQDIGSYMEESLGIPTEWVQSMECLEVAKEENVEMDLYLNALGAIVRR